MSKGVLVPLEDLERLRRLGAILSDEKRTISQEQIQAVGKALIQLTEGWEYVTGGERGES
jgi:hypothetical protein